MFYISVILDLHETSVLRFTMIHLGDRSSDNPGVFCAFFFFIIIIITIIDF